MAYVCGTLAQETDGEVEYFYPKTLSSMVEYDTSGSIKDKINKIDTDIEEVNNRITNLVSGVQYGSIGTKNDAELIDIRVPNYNIVSKDITYQSAGDAIREQFEVLITLINNIQKDLNKIKSTINIQ